MDPQPIPLLSCDFSAQKPCCYIKWIVKQKRFCCYLTICEKSLTIQMILVLLYFLIKVSTDWYSQPQAILSWQAQRKIRMIKIKRSMNSQFSFLRNSVELWSRRVQIDAKKLEGSLTEINIQSLTAMIRLVAEILNFVFYSKYVDIL